LVRLNVSDPGHNSCWLPKSSADGIFGGLGLHPLFESAAPSGFDENRRVFGWSLGSLVIVTVFPALIARFDQSRTVGPRTRPIERTPGIKHLLFAETVLSSGGCPLPFLPITDRCRVRIPRRNTTYPRSPALSRGGRASRPIKTGCCHIHIAPTVSRVHPRTSASVESPSQAMPRRLASIFGTAGGDG
jgi:hypothetical protein